MQKSCCGSGKIPELIQPRRKLPSIGCMVRACLKSRWNGLPARFWRQLAAEKFGGLVARRHRPVACATQNRVFKQALRDKGKLSWKRQFTSRKGHQGREGVGGKTYSSFHPAGEVIAAAEIQSSPLPWRPWRSSRVVQLRLLGLSDGRRAALKMAAFRNFQRGSAAKS